VNKTDRIGALIGIFVGAVLTAYAYYSNSHQSAPKINELVFLVLFPPSIGLMGTENASPLSEAFIVAVVVLSNGGFYALVTAVFREMLGSTRGTQ
jgi:hypothetical protein